LTKLIKILSASVGGGIVLGVGIRLGGAISGQNPDSGRKLSERLGELESRLMSLEGESPPEVSVVQSRLNRESLRTEALGEMSLRLSGELREWVEESVTARMAEVELRLGAESERGRKQMLDAFAESVQTRVIQRISKLEEEVAAQSAAMSELRECSLRTEQSIQKLLGGLGRLIVKHPPASEEAVNPSPADRTSPSEVITPLETSPKSDPLPGTGEALATLPEPPAFARQPKSNRWKIFG
jgi:uncharacterized coiled-coil protein SlyX